MATDLTFRARVRTLPSKSGENSSQEAGNNITTCSGGASPNLLHIRIYVPKTPRHTFLGTMGIFGLTYRAKPHSDRSSNAEAEILSLNNGTFKLSVPGAEPRTEFRFEYKLLYLIEYLTLLLNTTAFGLCQL